MCNFIVVSKQIISVLHLGIFFNCIFFVFLVAGPMGGDGDGDIGSGSGGEALVSNLHIFSLFIK